MGRDLKYIQEAMGVLLDHCDGRDLCTAVWQRVGQGERCPGRAHRRRRRVRVCPDTPTGPDPDSERAPWSRTYTLV